MVHCKTQFGGPRAAPCRGDRYRAALCAVAFAAILCPLSPASAQTVEKFYAGKTIAMLVPAAPGGSYDLATRVIARHLGKWIPGNPALIPQTMVGAGGLRAVNYLYEKAMRDGTVMAMPVQENVIADVVGGGEVRYKMEDFNWIGRLAHGTDVIAAWHGTGVKTIADATRVEVSLGATGKASGTSLYPMVLNNILGTKFKVVHGYRHTEILLAVERGEVGGAFTSLNTLKTVYPQWIADKKVNMLVAIAAEPAPELAGVPDIVSLAKTPEDKQVLNIFASSTEIGRSLMMPPQVPADRVAAVRAAFDAMVKDQDFQKDMAQAEIELGPKSGAALQDYIVQSRSVAPSVLARARAAIGL